MKNYYCFVDETGQDTKGKFFLVSVVLIPQDLLQVIESKLVTIEKKTNKNKKKWSRTTRNIKKQYINELITITDLKNSLFYSSYTDTKEYTALTALALT